MERDRARPVVLFPRERINRRRDSVDDELHVRIRLLEVEERPPGERTAERPDTLHEIAEVIHPGDEQVAGLLDRHHVNDLVLQHERESLAGEQLAEYRSS